MRGKHKRTNKIVQPESFLSLYLIAKFAFHASSKTNRNAWFSVPLLLLNLTSVFIEESAVATIVQLLPKSRFAFTA